MPGLLSLLSLATVGALTATLWRGLGPARALGVGLAATFLTASAVGLVLLDLGRLHASALSVCLAASFGLVWIGARAVRRRLPVLDGPRLAPGVVGCVAALVVLGGAALRLAPSPFLHGGQDQGIYVNVGHHIARTGRLRPVDRLLAGGVRGVRAADVREAYKIRPVAAGSPLDGVREGRWIEGIHIEDAGRGALLPAFFHLMPVWFAMAEHDWGFARSTWPLVLFWVLSGLAVFGLAARLHGLFGAAGDARRGALVGIVAVAALALHPLDLWISTFTVSENLARACLLAAAWLAIEAACAEREGRAGARLLAALGGLAFAAGAFTRGTLVAHALVLAAGLVLTPAPGSRARRAFLAALIAGTALAVMQAVMHSWPYFFSAATHHFHVPPLRPYPGEAIAWTGALAVFVWLADRGAQALLRRPRLADRARAGLRMCTGALLAAAAVVLVAEAVAPHNSWGPAQQVLPVLLRYGGALPLLLGLAGLAAAVRRADERTLPWLFLGAEILLFTALKQGIRYEFYYARYLVADAIPVLTIAAACGLGGLAERLRRRLGGRAAGLLAGAVALAWVVPPARMLTHEVFWTRDLADGPEQLAEMFGHVPDDAILIFDARAPGRWRGILATPALLSFGRQVLNYPDSEIVERAITAGTPVFMISGGWEAADRQRWRDPVRGPWRTEVVHRGEYRALRAEVVEGGAPARLTDWGGPYEVQRFDRSIWRSSGAFSLYVGSSHVRASAGGLETEWMEAAWPAGAQVELRLPARRDDCEIEAALRVDGAESRLTARPSAEERLRLWSLPPAEAGARWQIRLAVRCGEGALAWEVLSVRPPDA